MGEKPIELTIRDFRVEHEGKSIIIKGYVEKVGKPEIMKVGDSRIDFQQITILQRFYPKGVYRDVEHTVLVHLKKDLVGKLEVEGYAEILGTLMSSESPRRTGEFYYVDAERILSFKDKETLDREWEEKAKASKRKKDINEL